MNSFCRFSHLQLFIMCLCMVHLFFCLFLVCVQSSPALAVLERGVRGALGARLPPLVPAPDGAAVRALWRAFCRACSAASLRSSLSSSSTAAFLYFDCH